MKKAGLFLVFTILLVGLAVSQSYRGQGRLTGFVTDEEGKPIEGVRVTLYSVKAAQGFEVATDATGEWKAMYIRGGAWNIDFDKAGYAPKKISTRIQESFQNPPVQTKLQKIEGLIIIEDLKAALNEGNKLSEEKKYEEAIAVYEKLLSENPDAYVINKNIGNCYFELQKYDKAEEYYRKVLDKDPDNAEIMLLIGNCYGNRGEKDKAMEWYGKIEFDKITDPTVLFNIGSGFYSQSKYEEALKYYKRAVEIQKDFLDAIYQLGLTYLAMGNNAEAIATFEGYLKYDTDSPKANQVKNFLDFLKKQ
jgi:tetratricopeptide (TPR) repeat protein